MASMRTDTIKFLTLQETTRLFHRLASYRREKAIFLLAYRHGLRASEVGMLRIEHWRRQGDGPALAFTAQQPAFFRLPARGVERMDIKQGEGSSEGPSVAFSRSNHAM